MDKQKEAIERITGGESLFLTGSGGCVDLDTEFLTPQGWVKFSQYNGQQVLVYNTESNESVFEMPLKYIKLPCNKLSRISARGLDMVLCDNHRVIYWSKPSSKKCRELKFKDVKARHNNSIDGWQGKIKTTFNFDGKGVDFNEGELRLQVAVMADGRVVKEGANNYTQMRFKKKRKYDRLISICDKFKLNYKDNGFKSEYYEVIVWPKTPDKVFDSKFYSCSSDQLQTIVDEVGHWDSSLEGGSIRYVSRHKSDVDFIQFAFAACGYKTSIYEDSRKENNYYRVTATIKGSGFRSFASKGGKPKVKDYTPKDGFKYCFKVSTGAFVARRGGCIFITGNCGKSWVIDQVSDERSVLVAPTGIAALNIGGSTAHKVFKLPIGLPSDKDFLTADQKVYDLFRGPNVNKLIIDEVSMLRIDYFELIDHKLRKVKGNNEPFGGLQVVPVGDFFQLEPIISGREKPYFEYPNPFAFSSDSWNFDMLELTEVKRQSNKRQIMMLNSIRKKDKWYKKALLNIQNECKPYEENLDTLHLCCYNADADRINQKFYKKIDQPERVFFARYSPQWGKDYPVDDVLKLKLGAKVLICANCPNGSYVNGDRGTIVGFTDLGVQVETEDGRLAYVVENKWEKFGYNKTDNGVEKNVEAAFCQIPIKLGWAISVHKSQGMTLDNVALEIGRGCFSHGQLYVALSRIRDLKNLSIATTIDPTDVIVKDVVKRFYLGG